MIELPSKWLQRIESNSAALESNTGTHRSIGARFFHSPWSQDLPPELWSILHSLKPLISRFEDIEDSETRALPVENDHLLLLINRLHSLPRVSPLTPLQEAIRLGALIYLSVRVLIFEGNPCTEQLLLTLQCNFELSLPILTTTAPDLLFWILFVCGIASQGFKCHAGVVEMLRNSAAQLSLQRWDDALSVLEGYFFVYRRRNDPSKSLWDSIAERPAIVEYPDTIFSS